jgi:prepilin-type N-terminal cleavage/methylation domain-containing protein
MVMNKITYQKKNNGSNSGLTMVELIIVIAIMAIMVAASSIGFSLLSHGDSKKAVGNLSAQITELRTTALSKAGEWTAELYKIDNSYQLDIKKRIVSLDPAIPDTVETVSSTPIGSKILISYNDAQNKNIDENSKLVISFKQGSGKIDSVSLDPISGGTSIPLKNPSSQSGTITVKVNGSSNSNSLTLWYMTGKITTDY